MDNGRVSRGRTLAVAAGCGMFHFNGTFKAIPWQNEIKIVLVLLSSSINRVRLSSIQDFWEVDDLHT